MSIRKILSTITIFFLSAPHFYAQCTAENTAFQAGEELNYQLFFNWKFIW